MLAIIQSLNSSHSFLLSSSDFRASLISAEKSNLLQFSLQIFSTSILKTLSKFEWILAMLMILISNLFSLNILHAIGDSTWSLVKYASCLAVFSNNSASFSHPNKNIWGCYEIHFWINFYPQPQSYQQISSLNYDVLLAVGWLFLMLPILLHHVL